MIPDTIQELQTIVLFGIGSLFLYLLVPVALFANEVRLAKQSDDTSGTASIFNSIFQAFFYIVAWSVFVSIIVFLVVKFGHSGETNPAVGIDRFWHGEWMETNSTVVKGIPFTTEVINQFQNSLKPELETKAKLLVMIIVWAKALEYLLLGVLMALALKLSMSLPLLKMRRADHYKMTSQIDVGTMMGIFMAGVVGWVLFTVILQFESVLLSSLLEVGSKMPKTHINSTEVLILDDLKDLLKLGMKNF